MRIRAIFFLNNNITANEDDKQSFNYCLRSGRSSLQVKGLIQFEDDLVRIVKNWRFQNKARFSLKMLPEVWKKCSHRKSTNSRRQYIWHVQIEYEQLKKSFEKMSSQQLIKKQIKTLDQKSGKRVSSYINIYIKQD